MAARHAQQRGAAQQSASEERSLTIERARLRSIAALEQRILLLAARQLP
jgi:hypothetical protein